jgi:hypothetical protein
MTPPLRHKRFHMSSRTKPSAEFKKRLCSEAQCDVRTIINSSPRWLAHARM